MTILWIFAGVFTLLVITYGVIKYCRERRQYLKLATRPSSWQPVEPQDVEDSDSAYDVYIQKNNKL
jgi:hypothetical protein